MIDTSDFHNGLSFEWDGQPYQVVWFQHHKPGKGGAVLRCKMRNWNTGSNTERTFKAGERFRELSLEKKKKQYLYKEGDNYVFMDLETYEQTPVSPEHLGDQCRYLTENLEVEGVYLDGRFLGVELPASVEVKVIETVPGVRGNTVSNTTKPAKIDTGAEIRVPLFINEEDRIRVDTRTGDYVERVG